MAQLPVFVSWSGDRSKAAATALSDLLRRCLHQVKPWVSAESIRSGTRWFDEIGSTLSTYRFCVAVMAEDNLDSTWIHFEAGAIAKEIGNSFVVPYLVGVTPSQIQGPLRQFQAVASDEDGTRRLVDDLNALLGDDIVSEEVVADAFEAAWPGFSKRLEALPAASSAPPPLPDRDTQLAQIASRLDGIEGALRRLPRGASSLGRNAGPNLQMIVSDLEAEGISVSRVYDQSRPHRDRTFEILVSELPDVEAARALDEAWGNRDLDVTLKQAGNSGNSVHLGAPF